MDDRGRVTAAQSENNTWTCSFGIVRSISHADLEVVCDVCREWQQVGLLLYRQLQQHDDLPFSCRDVSPEAAAACRRRCSANAGK
mmetsp:Transcript_42672/g.112477  ORF Transcript_42672/g.112477 Transcript_42672/m.112477 type:complete len:85 (-) Transcript_42672:17-271(-)